jgi:hypothetical protein
MHVACLLVGGGVRVTIRNSRFVRCAVFDLEVGEFNGSGPPQSFLIENNFFAGTTDGGFYSLEFNTNTTALTDVVVRNNSATQGFYHANAIPLLTRVRFDANVAPLNSWDCNQAIAYSHNVWQGATCGATDVNAPAGFVDASANDLHLLPGAAAVDAGDPTNYAADDIDHLGRTDVARPKGSSRSNSEARHMSAIRHGV